MTDPTTLQLVALEALAEHVDRRARGLTAVPIMHASTYAWPSDVAANSALTERELRKALNELREHGLVYRERKFAHGHRFRITEAGWATLDGNPIGGA